MEYISIVFLIAFIAFQYTFSPLLMGVKNVANSEINFFLDNMVDLTELAGAKLNVYVAGYKKPKSSHSVNFYKL